MKDFPIIKVTIFFIVGILIQFICNIRIELLCFLTLLFLLLSIAHLFNSRVNPKLFSSYFLFLTIIFLGAITYCLSEKEIKPYPFKISKLKDTIVFGKVIDIELERSNEIRLYIGTDSAVIANNKFSIQSTFLCRIKDDDKKRLDSLYEMMKINNTIMVKGTLAKGRERRNPGEFDYQKYLENKGISGIINCNSLCDFKIISGEYNSFWTFIFNCRKSIDNSISRLYNPETAGLLKGLLLADRSEVSYETQNDFINTGVVHILAVSGSNVALILLIFQILVGRFNAVIRSLLTLLFVIIFILITGSSPSVIRAAIMGIVVITAFITNRSNNLYNSLALSALIILIINPKDLFDPGFQLSFSAVLSIIILVPFFKNRIKSWQISNKISKNIILITLVSLSAQIGTLPFTLYYFGKLSIVSLLANVIVVPIIGLISGIGIFSLVVSIVSNWCAGIYVPLNELLTRFIFLITHWLSSLKYSYFSIHSFSVLDAIIFYILITIFFFLYERFISDKARILLVLLIVNNLILLCSLDNKKLLPDNKLSVLAIDVGQGDAILIKFPDNKTALIDAGETNKFFDTGERIIIPVLDYLDIEKIDYGFISHIDSDHYSGFFTLLEKGRVNKIFKPALDTSSSKDLKFEKYLRAKNISYCYYNRQLIEPCNSRVYILNKGAQYNYNLSSNNNSGVMKVLYGNISFLFTGDAGFDIEKHFIYTNKDFMKSDVLKVSHHGSKYGTGTDFLKLVKPRISLISAGYLNKFKHPSAETLTRLFKVRSKVYRIDKEGAILLISDGNTIEKVNWREL